MATKLPVSRWQRDLSDSTVLRSVGSACGHCSIAYQATRRGLGRVKINVERIHADLESSWEVLAEAVQTVMRKHGLLEPYEQLKAATRGKRLDPDLYRAMLETLDLPASAKEELGALSPANYIGLANDLAKGPRS